MWNVTGERSGRGYMPYVAAIHYEVGTDEQESMNKRAHC